MNGRGAEARGCVGARVTTCGWKRERDIINI